MLYKMITRQVFIEITLCKAKNSRRIVLLIGEKHDKEKTFLKIDTMMRFDTHCFQRSLKEWGLQERKKNR